MNRYKVTFSGMIDSIEPEGDAYIYTGTILAPGVYKGIDGHTIIYEDSQRKIKTVFAEAAPTFNGRPLVYGHQLQTREAVKGFNAVAWLDGDVIRNKGYIFDPDIIELIKRNEFPMGQSMEAWVWTDNEMYAQRIEGTLVAIGIKKPAFKGALINQGKGVKLEMESEFIKTIKAKLEEQFKGDEHGDAIKAVLDIFEHVMEIPGENTGKHVLMSAERYVELKSAEEASKGGDSIKAELKKLTDKIGNMEKAKEKTGKDLLIGNIQVLNSDFKVDEYLEGVEDHSLQMRMLNAYYDRISDIEPILPDGGTEVQMTDDEEEKLFISLTGKSMKEFLAVKKEDE